MAEFAREESRFLKEYKLTQCLTNQFIVFSLNNKMNGTEEMKRMKMIIAFIVHNIKNKYARYSTQCSCIHVNGCG